MIFSRKMSRKAQTVSTDALIAVALFLIVVVFFISISTDTVQERKVGDLQKESSKLVTAVSGTKNNTAAFVKGSKVSDSEITKISNLTYDDLKDSLGLQADFCIHFEDEEGNVINVSGNKTGLGNSRVKVGGVACG